MKDQRFLSLWFLVQELVVLKDVSPSFLMMIFILL